MNEKNVRSIPELFGSMVFSQAQMRQRLPERVYDAWQQCLIQGTSLDRSIADEIAAAMKDWAIEKGMMFFISFALSNKGAMSSASKPAMPQPIGVTRKCFSGCRLA